MRIVYIADDGKEFDDEFDCLDYEWKISHPYLKDVRLYDEYNKELGNIFSEETYGIVERIIVPNENALKDFQELAIRTGFCCYEDVDECGEWAFDNDKEAFVKV